MSILTEPRLLFFSLALCAFPLPNDLAGARAQTPPVVQWVISPGIGGFTDLATDDSGHFYLMGSTRHSSGDSQQWLVRYTAEGVQVWKKRLYWGRDTVGGDLVVGGDGGIYAAHHAGESNYAYLSPSLDKFSAEGDPVLSVPIGGDASISGLAADEAGGMFLCGSFGYDLTIADTSVFGKSDHSDRDLFLARLAPDGQLVWMVSTGVADYATASDPDQESLRETCRGVAVDAAGEAYFAGSYEETVTFGDTTLTGNGASDLFLVKYSPDGSLVWAERAGGSGGISPAGVATGPAGEVYVAGTFTEAASFGMVSLTSAGAEDLFAARYAPTGALVWARSAGGPGRDVVVSPAADPSGGIYLTGNFELSASFGATTLLSRGALDLFLARLDAAGAFEWAQQAGGPGYVRSHDLAVTSSGDLFLSGSAGKGAVFGSPPVNVTCGQGTFLARYSSDADPAPNIPPASFELAEPHAHAIVALTSHSLTFSWEASEDPEGRPLQYRLSVGTDSLLNQGHIAVCTVDTTFSVDAWRLEDDQRYWWHVDAFDGQGGVRTSETRSFMFDSSPEAPSSVSLLAPAGAQILSSEQQTFRWSKASDQDPYDQITYRLLIATDAEFSNLIRTVETSDTTITLSESLPERKQYYWRVDTVDLTGRSSSSQSDTFEVRSITELMLDQNFPNPFRRETTIRFNIPEAALVRLRIYDLLGREVRTLVEEDMGRGWDEVQFNGSSLPAGVYFYRLEAGGKEETGRMLLMR